MSTNERESSTIRHSAMLQESATIANDRIVASGHPGSLKQFLYRNHHAIQIADHKQLDGGTNIAEVEQRLAVSLE
jgi:hypothetical protein